MEMNSIFGHATRQKNLYGSVIFDTVLTDHELHRTSQYRIWMVLYHIPLERGKLVNDRDKYPTDSMWFQEESQLLSVRKL